MTLPQQFRLMRSLLLRITPITPVSSRGKKTIDDSQVPKLNDEDLEEDFARGSGPGGQAVNKTSNAVILKHKPTGLVVKCHQSRSLDMNRKTAREILIQKLDNLFNGEMSVEAQKKRILDKKSRDSSRKSEKNKALKQQWKESCLLYTSPSPRDRQKSRMPSSA